MFIQDGVFLVNKRAGRTSNQELTALKKRLNVKKMGHAGTLDKFASGLMVIATGKYTKLLDIFLKFPKWYFFEVDFTKITETLDPEGETVESFAGELSRNQVADLLPAFQGKIHQTPPLYSALKVHGRRLSDCARLQAKGVVVSIPEIASREIEIYRLRLYPKSVSQFVVHCSSGTYVRSLARDIGQRAGMGGTTIRLCRTRIGSWHYKRGVRSEDVGSDPQSLEIARLGAADFRKLGCTATIDNSNRSLLTQGRVPQIEGLQNIQSGGLLPLLFVFDTDQRLVAFSWLQDMEKEQRSAAIDQNRMNRRILQKSNCQNIDLSRLFTKWKILI